MWHYYPRDIPTIGGKYIVAREDKHIDIAWWDDIEHEFMFYEICKDNFINNDDVYAWMNFPCAPNKEDEN